MFTTMEIILAWITAAGASFLQGIIGFGFAVLSVPILTLIDPRFTPIPVLLVAPILTVTMALRERRHFALSGAGWVIAGRLPGAIIGVWLLSAVTRRTLDALISGVVITVAVALLAGVHIRRNHGTEFATGVASGVTGITSAIGGPPVAMLYASSSGGVLRSNLAGIFTIGILINIATLAIGGQIEREHLATAALLVPPLVFGLIASTYLAGKIEGAALRAAILIVSIVAGVALAVRTAAGG